MAGPNTSKMRLCATLPPLGGRLTHSALLSVCAGAGLCRLHLATLFSSGDALTSMIIVFHWRLCCFISMILLFSVFFLSHQQGVPTYFLSHQQGVCCFLVLSQSLLGPAAVAAVLAGLAGGRLKSLIRSDGNRCGPHQ